MLPVSSGGLEGLAVEVDRVRVEPAANTQNARPVDIAAILERLLTLPELFPEFRVDVATLNVEGYPELTGLIWQSYDRAQAFAVYIAGHRLAAELEAMDEE